MMGVRNTEEESNTPMGKENDKRVDAAKLNIDLELGLSGAQLPERQVWKVMKQCTHFENAGNPVQEADGGFVLIEDAKCMGYDINVWINYKPYSPSDATMANEAQGKKHMAACLRDGWGKMFVCLSKEMEEESTALAVLDLMRHKVWGDLESKAEFLGFLEI